MQKIDKRSALKSFLFGIAKGFDLFNVLKDSEQEKIKQFYSNNNENSFSRDYENLYKDSLKIFRRKK